MKWETTNTNQTVSMIGMSLRDFIYFPNVPIQESPLASGMASAREAEPTEAMPEVPKGR